MGIVNEKDYRPALRLLVQELRDSSRDQDRVLQAAQLQLVEQDAQGPVGKLRGDCASPNAQDQRMLPNPFQCPVRYE